MKRSEEAAMKEKYIRDSGKIEDYPGQKEVAKMSSEPDAHDGDELADLQKQAGEEKKGDYADPDAQR